MKSMLKLKLEEFNNTTGTERVKTDLCLLHSRVLCLVLKIKTQILEGTEQNDWRLLNGRILRRGF